MNPDRKQAFLNGMKVGVPIGLGYFAVSFSLGIMARNAGITPVEGFITSVLALASAGEYAGFSMILYQASFVETVLVALITNARYMLMTTALSQRFSQDTSLGHRIAVAQFTTDEIFGANISRPGDLVPQYTYGMAAVAAPLWGLGTSLGIIAGNGLPVRVVSALSVALYGMFIAIIVPPCKSSRTVLAAVAVSFLLSYLCCPGSIISELIPAITSISSGTRIFILTVVISAVAALVRPVESQK